MPDTIIVGSKMRFKLERKHYLGIAWWLIRGWLLRLPVMNVTVDGKQTTLVLVDDPIAYARTMPTFQHQAE